MKTLLMLLLAFSAPVARADLQDAFAKMDKNSKGPFTLNYLQGSGSRTSVASGASPRGFLFQAAFRNDDARRLAETYGFYVGNLFTTNYYELVGEYAFGNAYGSHPLDTKKLLANKQAAMPKAAMMAQHWVLEKHYLKHLHDSKLSKAFRLRGISGSEFEQAYANHFFNFFLEAMDNEFQYLTAFLLVNESPIVDSASLAKAREMIASSYDFFKGRFGAKDARSLAMYRLRNAIHNQLSPDVIRQIDSFVAQYPFYKKEGHTYLFTIRQILVDYYGFGADKIAKQAAKLDLFEVQACAERLVFQGVSASALTDLSRAAANLRSELRLVPYERRAQALAVLASVSQYISKELPQLKDASDAQLAEMAVNAAYVEGFLIKDNWEYFVGELASGDPATVLLDLIEVAAGAEGSTLYEAFSPSFGQWVSIEPKMQYFMDNTIKSSALATAATIAERIKR